LPSHIADAAVVAQASIAATAKLLASLGLGVLAAKKGPPNLLNGEALAVLSRLTYWIFQPAFLFASVSKTLYTAAATTTSTAGTAGSGLSLQALWLLPMLAVGQILCGAVGGRILAKLYGADQNSAERNNVYMCTTFANSGPLPLIFTDALFGTSNAVLQSQMAAGISFYLLAWSPLFWTLGKLILASEEDEDDETDMGTDTTGTTLSSWKTSVQSTLIKILSPPVIGSLVGLLVGMIPTLRNVVFGPFGKPLYGALQTLGTAYLPAALLVLAGSLVGGGGSASSSTTKTPVSSTTNTTTTTTTNNDTTAPTLRGMAAIATYRFFISPVLTLVVATQWIAKLTWMDTRTRAIIMFLCLMEGCMPPAQNSVILLQLANRPGPAAAMAKLLTILYTTAVLPVTLLLSACLQQSGILAFV
jgi:predicted permease